MADELLKLNRYNFQQFWIHLDAKSSTIHFEIVLTAESSHLITRNLSHTGTFCQALNGRAYSS